MKNWKKFALTIFRKISVKSTLTLLPWKCNFSFLFALRVGTHFISMHCKVILIIEDFLKLPLAVLLNQFSS